MMDNVQNCDCYTDVSAYITNSLVHHTGMAGNSLEVLNEE
jgi:hypothetical protein